MGDRTEGHHRPPPTTNTLAEVVELLGSHTLSVLAAPQGLGSLVSGTVLYDRFESLPPGRGALLFASGLREGDPGWSDLVGRAATSGYCALVLKRWSGDTQLLVAASSAARLALLTIPAQAHWHDLDALVNGVLGAAGRGIGPTTGEGPDLLALANNIAARVGGSVAIEDLDRRILEYSSVKGQRIDALRREGILAHRVPDVPSNLAQYRLVLSSEGVVHFDADAGEMARSAVTIRAGARPLGTIWVIERLEGLSAKGRSALCDGARLAALHLLRARQAREMEMNARSTALLAALDGFWNVDDTTFRSFPPAGTHLTLIGFAPSCSPAGTRPTTATPMPQIGATLTRYFAAFCPGALVATTARTVFVLVPGDTEKVDRLTEAALGGPDQSPGDQLRAAISFSTTDPAELAMMRSEVEQVLVVTTKERGLPTVAHLADVYAGVVLNQVAEVLRVHPRLRHVGVDAMAMHDRTYRTEYAASVLAWLDAVGDISEAARRIGVHSNTLRYRLKRAGELFALDLDRPDDRLSLWMQLRLSR